MREGLAQMESPFTSKFGTNFAPSPKEILDIQKILLEPAKELHALDEQIAQLQARRDKLKSFIDNHRALLSPIRRVPSDILREIFVQCLPKDHLPTHNIHQAPLLLTGICRSWREVAITTPRLWNRIHIVFRYPCSPPVTDFFRSLMKANTEGLDLWLERSGTMPLTLSLNAHTPFASNETRWTVIEVDEIEALCIDFAQHLLPYAPRWARLSMSASARVMDFLKALPEELELTSLKEFKPQRRGSVNWAALDVVFRRSPSLHSVQLDKAYLDKLPIRWGNLTEVVLSGPLGDDLLPHHAMRVLSLSCSSIRRCTLYIQSVHETSVSSIEPPVVLPFLHALKVHFRYNRFHRVEFEAITLGFQHLLDAITAPMLKSLYITSPYSHPPDNFFERISLLSFLDRSGRALSSLTLDLPVKVADLIAVLQLAPSLAELNLRNVGMEANASYSEFFEALTPTSTNPDILCPRLESLTYTEGDTASSSPASLIALAEARSCVEPRYPGVQKLKWMSVALREFVVDPEIPAKLRGLREQGMMVQWRSPPDLRNRLSESDWRDLDTCESRSFNTLFFNAHFY
ncbi:hypothetical protein Moror_17147 [Moniliophthora roreri MCA 2997]|uniref:Uncharacterized protein n=2 Tax=Moniliophthora roreri TaxID=221103 RepID=V2YAP2_MONRO|nr:hypothetical protein Moror_17147 [Moniliophthora roreri MCA 2997]KAI3602779.1 hypothetical protein WG66_008117 [Moniliophthora roreri]